VLDFSVVEGRGRNVSPVTYGGEVDDDERLSITLTLSDVLGTGETLTLLRNGTATRTLTSGNTLSFTESLDDGVYSYTARIVDSAGNLATLDLNGALPGNDFTFRVA
jgi:hypothetical protein